MQCCIDHNPPHLTDSSSHVSPLRSEAYVVSSPLTIDEHGERASHRSIDLVPGCTDEGWEMRPERGRGGGQGLNDFLRSFFTMVGDFDEKTAGTAM
ncbi:hypothetical protein RRG08_002164 [Elysia crispata]|uniref:Uncharacterized protein n=1 Tax=Elysia crispata TaxID=231223 RepID=A0AAE0ZAU0_9GAST|nr:hypothetical protein RRG08_002164 [Elysia crispata]